MREAYCPCPHVAAAVRCTAASPGCHFACTPVLDSEFEMLTCLGAAQPLKLPVTASPMLAANALLTWLTSTVMPQVCLTCQLKSPCAACPASPG